MNARVIIGEQHIGDATEAERDAFAGRLVDAMEAEFPGLSVDYNPLGGAAFEWQEEDGVDTQEVEDWVSRNWESVLVA